MDVSTPEQTHTIHAWEITLNCGVRSQLNIRLDLGDTVHVSKDGDRLHFTWKKPVSHTTFFAREIAAINYTQITQKEIPKFTPNTPSRFPLHAKPRQNETHEN